MDEATQYHTHMWEQGLLSWLCFDYQDAMYESLHRFFEYSDEKVYVVNCSRRFGKTTVLIIIGLEFAYREPNSIIRFPVTIQ